MVTNEPKPMRSSADKFKRTGKQASLRHEIELKSNDVFHKLSLVLIPCMLLLLGGCEKEKAPKPLPDPKPLVKEEKQKKPEFVIKEEVYGDPSSFDSPRLQFTWQAPTEQNRSIWSCKIDGTDLRRAVSWEKFQKGGIANIVHIPRRSPDNRYIVFTAGGSNKTHKPFRWLADLKTGEMKVIATGSAIAAYNWTADSKTAVFDVGGTGMVEYHVDTGKLTVRKGKERIDHGAGYFLSSENRFYAFVSRGYKVYDYDGNLLNDVKLIPPGETIGTYPYHYVSHNGKYVFYRYQIYSHLIAHANPDKVLFKSEDLGPVANDGKTVYVRVAARIIHKIDVTTGQSEEIVNLRHVNDSMAISKITLFNEK